MTEDYATFDVRFKAKEKECKELVKSIGIKDGFQKELQKLSDQQAKKIAYFEDKYKNIDIAGMHEEIESIKTRVITAELSEKAVQNQLYEVRERILTISNAYDSKKAEELAKMKAKPKTYAGPATEWADPEEARKVRQREFKAKKNSEWKGQADIEEICRMYMDFLTTPTFGTFLDLEDDRARAEAQQKQAAANAAVDASAKKAQEEVMAAALAEGGGDPEAIPEDIEGENA